MKMLKYLPLLAIFILSQPISLYAGLSCSALFGSTVPTIDSRSKLPFTMSSEIPEKKQLEISEVVEKVVSIAGPLKLPLRISFALDHKRESVGSSNFLNTQILFLPEMLKIPKEPFQAMIAHEITHFIVIRNFSSRDCYASLEEEYFNYSDQFMPFGIMHGPYAELLGDLMSVMVLKDPKAISKLLPFAKEFAANGEWIAHDFKDDSDVLYSRDFSLSPKDPRWINFKPEDNDLHNRFNQVRSYLWDSWLSKLKPEQYPKFFWVVMGVLNEVYVNQYFDYMALDLGLYKSNMILTQALEMELSKVFGHP